MIASVLLVRMSADRSPMPPTCEPFMWPDSLAAVSSASHTSAGRKLSHLRTRKVHTGWGLQLLLGMAA